MLRVSYKHFLTVVKQKKGLNILIDFLRASQVFVENTKYGKIFPHFSKEQYLESEKIWNDKNPCHPLDMAKKNIPTIPDIRLSFSLGNRY